MMMPAISNRLHGRPNFAPSSLLLLGFIAAAGLRVLIGRPQVAQSVAAGVVFAGCLTGLSLAAGVRWVWSRRAVWIGLLGGLALCVPAYALHAMAHRGWAPAAGYGTWSMAASVVALSEELFLRGALYEAVTTWRGEAAAVFIGAIAFACLHIPLYGWHVVPLDFGVGLFLGWLRLLSGSVVAPEAAHVAADLAGWWVR